MHTSYFTLYIFYWYITEFSIKYLLLYWIYMHKNVIVQKAWKYSIIFPVVYIFTMPISTHKI